MKVENEDIRQFSLKDLKRQRQAGETETRDDAPAYPVDAEFWKSARIVTPSHKTAVNLRVDDDVLEWFRKQGKGHLTRMSAVLRSFMEAHKG